jgi:hypothetical protein
MSDEHVVLNDDAFTDKAVTGDLAASTDAGVFLDFDECPDLGLGPNLAPIEVYEFGETDVLPQFDVVRDAVVGVHR